MIKIMLKSGEALVYTGDSALELDLPYYVKITAMVDGVLERHYIQKQDVAYIRDSRQ